MANYREQTENCAYYRVITTLENGNGEPVNMYGIEGFTDEEVVTITSLSEDYDRISGLVKNMNKCSLALCQLRDVVDDFLYEAYGKRSF